MLLTLLMNLDFAAGEVIAPPIPPIPIPETGGGGGGGWGYPGHYKSYEEDYYEKRRKRIRDEKRRNKVKEENEFILEFLKIATNIINNQ